MPIHAHPLVVQIRFYDELVDVDKPMHEMHSQYRGVANVMIDDDGVGRVSLLKCENFSKTDFESVKTYLRSMGAVKMSYKHKDREREVWI